MMNGVVNKHASKTILGSVQGGTMDTSSHKPLQFLIGELHKSFLVPDLDLLQSRQCNADVAGECTSNGEPKNRSSKKVL